VCPDDGEPVPVQVPLDEYLALLDGYRIARRTRDVAVKEMETAREQIEKLLPDVTDCPDGVVGTVGGQPQVLYVPHARRDIDRDLLRRRYPHIAEECTTWQVRRPFVVTAVPANEEGS